MTCLCPREVPSLEISNPLRYNFRKTFYNQGLEIRPSLTKRGWPPPAISPYFYAKPITWFSYFSFLYWAFGLESFRTRFLNMSYRARRFLFIGTAFIAFGAFYEIFFNFTIWSALLAVCSQPANLQQCNPDTLVNIFPNLRTPLNLTFATKVVTTVFGLSVYSLWFLYRTDRDLDRKALGVSIE